MFPNNIIVTCSLVFVSATLIVFGLSRMKIFLIGGLRFDWKIRTWGYVLGITTTIIGILIYIIAITPKDNWINISVVILFLGILFIVSGPTLILRESFIDKVYRQTALKVLKNSGPPDKNNPKVAQSKIGMAVNELLKSERKITELYLPVLLMGTIFFITVFLLVSFYFKWNYEDLGDITFPVGISILAAFGGGFAGFMISLEKYLGIPSDIAEDYDSGTQPQKRPRSFLKINKESMKIYFPPAFSRWILSFVFALFVFTSTLDWSSSKTIDFFILLSCCVLAGFGGLLGSVISDFI